MLSLLLPLLAAEPVSARGAPPLEVVAFQDAAKDDEGRPSLNCSALDARYGRCVERVNFSVPAWNGEWDTQEQVAEWKNVSDLYESLWTGMAHRWQGGSDVIVATLGADGYAMPPDSKAIWDQAFATPKDGNRPRTGVALPDQSAWLDREDWGVKERPGIFRPLKMVGPTSCTAETCPSTTVLAGRFALRLGYDGRPYDWDLMDSDPASAGPFFEQLYPYRGTRYRDETGREALLRPLAGYAVSSDTHPPVLLPKASYREFTQRVTEGFTGFYEQLGSDVLRYGMRDYTTNQLRVFTALSAMNNPPGGNLGRGGRTRDLVAAARGQTDTSEDRQTQAALAAFTVSGIFDINYSSLPLDLARRWLESLVAVRDDANLPLYATPDFFSKWSQRTTELVKPRLISNSGDVPVEDIGKIEDWLHEHLANNDPKPYMAAVFQGGLAELIAKMSPHEQDQFQTWILLDQLSESIATAFDPSAAKAPGDVVVTAMDQWQSVLSGHRQPARSVEQGVGAVDPMSICTTRDGLDALKEPVVSAINFDLIVSATDVSLPASLSPEEQAELNHLQEIAATPDEKKRVKDDYLNARLAERVLWESRSKIPFVLVDDPETAVPKVTRLVGLAPSLDEKGQTVRQAIFRIRWQLWSGWHLLWYPSEGRLKVRTAPICESTALAPTSLVPTLTRAALLEGELRPSTPVYRPDLRGKTRWRPEKKQKTNDEALADTQAGAASAQESATAAKDTVTTIQSAPDAKTVAGLLTAPKESAYNLTSEPVTEPVRYLRELVYPHLRKLSGSLKGMMLFVFDSSLPGQKVRASGDLSPRTPYLRVRRPAGKKGRLQTAGWAWWWPEIPQPDPYMVAPAWNPTGSVATQVEMPRWHQNSTLDWHLGAGLNLMPLRRVSATCSDNPANYDVVAACSIGNVPMTTANGIGLDLRGLATWWVAARPRLGLELGPIAALSVVPSGAPAAVAIAQAVDPNGDIAHSPQIDYAWTFRPEGGILVGLRYAPRPPGLWTPGTYGWGADRPDGQSRLGRVEYGMRLGLTLGPGFNGLESTALGELWLGASLRGKGPLSNLTPYHPSVLVGPYLRGELSYLLVDPTTLTQYRILKNGYTLFVGIHGEFRLSAPPTLPEPK